MAENGLILSKLVEEIRVLAYEEAYFLCEVETDIDYSLEQLSKLNASIRLHYLTSVTKFQKEQGEQAEQIAIECAMEVKRATEHLILLKAVQQKKGYLNKISFFLNDLMDMYRATRKLNELGNPFWVSCVINSITRLNVGFETVVLPRDMRRYVADSASYVDTDDVVVGRDEDITAIITKLMISSTVGEDQGKSQRYVLSISGEKGTGKTTVARKVFHDATVRSHFDCFAWISNGDSYDTMTRALLIDLLSQLTMGCSHLPPNGHVVGIEDEGPGHLKKLLYDFLKDKRYLIVIDNYGQTPVWDELFFFGKESPTTLASLGLDESRIMTTGTYRFPNCHEIGPLSEASSWEMFTTKVSNTMFSREKVSNTILKLPSDVLSIGKQLVNTCGGLPAAIESLMNSIPLIEPTYDSWLRVLKGINKVSEPSLDEMSTALPLNMQRCFYYLQLFPKDYEIPVRRLIALWIAEDMVTAENDLPLEMIGKSYIKMFIDKDIIQVKQFKVDGRPKTCCLNQLWHTRMLSLVHQANNNDARAVILGTRQLNVSHTNEIQSRILKDKNFEPYRYLLTFLCFDYRRSFEPSRHVKQFFRGGIDRNCLLSLKVLDLEGVYKPELPKEMERLTNLRYLG